MNPSLFAAKALGASTQAVRSLRCLKSLRLLSGGTRRRSAASAAGRTGSRFAEMNAGAGSAPGSQPILKHLKSRDKRRAAGGGSTITHSPSSVYLQVVNSGARGSAPALFLFSDFNRYLFNCGEGVQRVMMEHKLKMSRLDKIFFTRMTWNNVGGLSGMILSMKDLNIPECSLFGPPELEKFLEGVNVFAPNIHDIKLVVEPCREMESVDETMALQQIPIFANKSKGYSSLTMAYICKLHERKGTFLLANAKALGLPIGTKNLGPMVTDFKHGKSVFFNGREIRPEEVLTPSDPGPAFLVVECPDVSFVNPVTSNASIHRHQTGGNCQALSLVVHMAPDQVVCHPLYQDWMQRFGSSTEHLLLNECTPSLHHLRSYQIQTQLHLVHPHVFPALPERDDSAQAQRPAFKLPLVMGQCLLRFQLRPKVTWQRDWLLVLDEAACHREAAECAEFTRRVEEIAGDVRGDGGATEEDSRWPEVVFLGTGSAMPMKTRNVSGTLLRISADRAVMLDCGEGTLGQLARHCGGAMDSTLSALGAVFVSHMHADHHTGLVNLLLNRERALSALGKPWKPLVVIGPPKMLKWLNIYHEHCQPVLHLLTFLPSQTFLKISLDSEDIPDSVHDLYTELDIVRFETCYVQHCFNAFGCALTHARGWKVVFSGDTMPCESLVNMGKGATLLIHEATLEDGLEEEALEKTHSTTSQAVDVGVRMGATFTLLNHFSQRYAKIPLLHDLTARVGITFDHMQIRFSDFPVLPKLIPPLKALFALDIEEMEERKDKRFYRQYHQYQKSHQHQQPQQPHKQQHLPKEAQKQAASSDQTAVLTTAESSSSESLQQSSAKRGSPTRGEVTSGDESSAKRARLVKGGASSIPS